MGYYQHLTDILSDLSNLSNLSILSDLSKEIILSVGAKDTLRIRSVSPIIWLLWLISSLVRNAKDALRITKDALTYFR